jgi:hypothetical protein
MLKKLTIFRQGRLMIRIFLCFAILISSGAWADAPISILGRYEESVLSPKLLNTNEYRVGDEWGKTPVTEDVMNKSAAIRRAAMATSRTGGGTGFVLGEFAGHVVVATNHHVCPASYNCDWQDTNFPLLNVQASQQEFIGSWPEVDLALYTIAVSGAQKSRVLNVAQNFDFDTQIVPGQALITSGFGVAGNAKRSMVINYDSDCRVMSARNEFRLMNDPDAKNPASYRAWSFANGCDVSHGDSGSAMVDAASGAPVGIIWTGKIPKSNSAQSSARLNEWQNSQSPEVWSELSYAVPAPKIYEFLRRQLDSGEIEPRHEAIVRAILE